MEELDVQELGALLSRARRPANVAFLASVCTYTAGGRWRQSTASGKCADDRLDDEDICETRRLLGEGRGAASIAALASLLLAHHCPDSDFGEHCIADGRDRAEVLEARLDRDEAIGLLARASRSTPRWCLTLTAAACAAACVRASRCEPGAAADSSNCTAACAHDTTALAETATMEVETAMEKEEAAAAAAAAAAGYIHLEEENVGSLVEVDLERTVLLIHPQEMAAEALLLAARLCNGGDREAARRVLVGGAAASALSWRIANRYYSTDLSIVLLPDDTAQPPSTAPSAAPSTWLPSLASRCGALLLLFGDGESWQRLRRAWQDPLREDEIECEIMLAVSTEKTVTEAEAEARMLWCVESGVEYVSVDLHSEEHAPATPGARAGEETEGLARLSEALQCRVWPEAPTTHAAEAASAQTQSTETAALDAGDATAEGADTATTATSAAAAAVAATGAGTTAGTATAAAQGQALSQAADAAEDADAQQSSSARLAARDAAAEAYMEQLVETAAKEEKGASGADSAEDENKEMDRLERLMSQMGQLRNGGDAMRRENRVDQAAKLAMELASLLGEGGDGEDSDSD